MQRLGRYEIFEELGHGAMGTVYRARDPKIDRIVALKTVNVTGAAAAAKDYRQRFFREAQAAGKLSHPSIVTIYDVGEDETAQTSYIVMEYIAGQTLESLVTGAAMQRLPLATTLALVQQVAAALDYAHAQGIIHRDIKPANIIVTLEGRAKITDFGIAKLARNQFTLPGLVLGTPFYMAPEQLTGGALDSRCDLFSLGVILYWMLTGEKPFKGDTTTEVAFKIVYTDPLPVTQLNPALRPEFDYVLDRALAKDPARRYQRGTELANDLDDLHQGRPPRSQAQAAATSVAERTMIRQPLVGVPPPQAPLPAAGVPVKPLPAKPHRGWTAAALVLLVLVLGSGGSWWWLERHGRTPGQASDLEQAGGTRVNQVGIPPTTQDSSLTQAAVESTQRTTEKPPSRASAVGRQRQQRKPTPIASATLKVWSRYNFRHAAVYIWVEDELKYTGTIRSEERHVSAGATQPGPFEASLSLTPGWHNITVRVTSQDDEGFDERREIQGEFGPDMERTLELHFGKIGFLGNSRKLSLRWKKR